MQVTAQLDEERTAKLKRLQSLTQLSADEILSHGIDLVEQQQTELWRERSDATPNSGDAILKSGFVGCLKDAPADLATNYRQYFAELMQEKYDAMQEQYDAG